MHRLALACLLALAALAPGCGNDEPAAKVDLENRALVAPPPPEPAITYAYLPQYAHTVSRERHRRLIAYLEQQTGLRLRQVFPDTFEQHIAMAEAGAIDISFVNPFVYVKMAAAGATAFARGVEPDRGTNFRGEIIARADNAALGSLADCKGKRWMAVDPSSAAGFLYPLGLFYEQGVRRRDFAALDFAPGPGGKQEQVIMAVYAGAYDLGSVREGALALMADKIDPDQIKVLARTRAYPGWLYAARAGLDPAVTSAIATALFSLDPRDPDQARILEAAGMSGVIPASDADFDPIRELVARLTRVE